MTRIEDVNAARIAALEEQGMSHSDAAAVAMAEDESRCEVCGERLTVEGDGDGSGDPQHVFCDICGKAEHPTDLTPDWNGETGNHLSCEATWKATPRRTSLVRADLDLVAGDWGITGPTDELEQLAARFERNAADWRQVRGNPDLNDVKGAGYAAGMAEAYMLAAADIRRTLRGDDPPGWDGAGADVEAQRG